MTTHAAGEPYAVPEYGLPGPYGDQPTMELRRFPEPRRTVEPEPSAGSAVDGASSTGRNGLIMAMGSLASRALGFVRSAVIAYAIGVGGLAATYNVGNSLPTIVYQMLIGGVLGSVFVPELVRAAQTDLDGGAAFTDRLLTLCTVILVVLTTVAVFAAPFIVTLYAPDALDADRALTIAFARYCLPQIMFYGLFTLLGQVLNARGRFGAMMWTPVLNNVVVIAVFGLYIAVSGATAEHAKDLTSGQAMLLGFGSTLGIVLQALGLLPSLRAAKFRWRPRFDWRGAGLTRPLRSAGWALALVLVTQLFFAVITQLTTRADTRGTTVGLDGVGNVAYTNAYQLFLVPQGIITISLVTAVLPRMSRAATAGDLPRIGAEVAQVLRSSAGMIVPATVLFVALAPQITSAAYGYGNSGSLGIWVISQALALFAVGIPAFCTQYALARGFYALGDARTPFWLTVASSGTNAGLSCLAYWLLPLRWIVIGMAGAQTVACVLGMAITGRALSRRLRTAPAGPPDRTMTLRIPDPREPVRSGLDGRKVFGLHVGVLLACLPGAFLGRWLADEAGSLLGHNVLGNLLGLAVGSLTVLVSLFVLARPFKAADAVVPLARKLRVPYPAPPAAAGGRHRR